MSYSSLLTNNTSASAVAAGGIIPLGSAIHGFGRSIKLNGNNINLIDTGYYRVIANTTVAVTGTGAESITLNVDNTAVNTASATPTAAGSSVNMTLVWLIRKSCCKDTSALNFTLAAGGTVNAMTVEVEKV